MKKGVEMTPEGERLRKAFMKKTDIAIGWLVVLIMICVVSIVVVSGYAKRVDRAENMANYYAQLHDTSMSEKEIAGMTAQESYNYAVKMFNIDVGRYGYQDLKMVVMILALAILLGLTFHGFKLVYVRRNG